MNFLGIGSGLDLSTMLDGLVRVASEPKVQQLGRREIQLEDSLSGLGMLKSSLSDFQDAVDALKDGGLYTKMMPSLTQPESGDLISVTAGTSAVASNYDIEVVSLAAGSKAMSDWRSEKYQSDFFEDEDADLGKNGTLTVNGIAITIETTDSLKEIASKINAESALTDSGVSAAVVDGRLEYYAAGHNELVTATASNTDLDVFSTDNGMTKRADSSTQMNAGEGELTFSADGNEFKVTLSGGESLDDLVSLINSADGNFGVTANVIDGRLVYQSAITGAGNNLSVTATQLNPDTDAGIASTQLANLNMLSVGVDDGDDTTGSTVELKTAASDAEIKVDGVSITNDTNVFDGAISGLTITAEKESVAGETAGLTVGNSSGEVKSRIESFAKAYNKLREQMNELKGSTDEEGNFIAGKLTNDPIIRNVESVLNGLVSRQISGIDDGFDTLYSVGLEIESDGTLNTDSDRLSAALGSMDSLQILFAGSGQESLDGLADIMSSDLDNFVSFTGVIKGKEDTVQQQLDDLDEQYEAHARYIESYQKTLKQQFTALDATMAKMNSIMQYIGPQLAALPGVAK